MHTYNIGLFFGRRIAMKYWVGVVSESHVNLGIKGGFAQLCHGKRAPLSKMQNTEWRLADLLLTENRDGIGSAFAGVYGDWENS